MKKGLFVLILVVLLVPMALAGPKEVAKDVFDSVVKIGNLSFLGLSDGVIVVGLVRILIAIMVFAIFFGVLTSLDALSFVNRAQAAVIAAVLAVISAVFMPAAVILAVGTGWATVVSLVLIAAPVVGIAAILMYLPNSCAWFTLKLVLSLVLFWILNAMKFHIAQPGLGISQAVVTNVNQFIDWGIGITVLIIIYYLFRLLTCGESDDSGRPSRWRRLFNRLRPGGSWSPGGENRPAGRVPPPTRGRTFPGDPPTRVVPPPGVVPGGPKVKPKLLPKKPKIPDEEEIFIDLSANFLDIRSQGTTSACTAFAAVSVFEYNRNVHNSIKEVLSPMYNWYRARQIEGKETENRGLWWNHNAAKALVDSGTSSEQMWSFEQPPSTKYAQPPSFNAEEDANTKKVESYVVVTMTDPDQWVRQLEAGNPLDIAVDLPSELDIRWRGPFYINRNPVSRGGHAMVIVGYHSHYPHNGRGVKAFKIRNSWGAGWAEYGYFWIDAATLLAIIAQDPIVLVGWSQKGSNEPDVAPAHLGKFTITGRAILEHPQENPIPSAATGEALYKGPVKFNIDNKHDFVVGALAQIQGKIVVLNEVVVGHDNGRFEFSFEADPRQFEPLTKLRKWAKKQSGRDFYKHTFFKKNMKKLPAGVVVFKHETKEDHAKHGPEWYFHMVDGDQSWGGRGGEGRHAADNPCSGPIHQIPISGTPIVFTKDHVHEKNVIIPVFFEEEEDVESKQAKDNMCEFAKKSLDWSATDFNFIQELEQDVQNKNVNQALAHLTRLGQSERKLHRLSRQLALAVRHHIEKLKGEEKKQFAELAKRITIATKSILHHSSRYEGAVRTVLEKIRKDSSLLGKKGGSMNAKSKEKLEGRLEENWSKLDDQVSKVATWVTALQAELKKLEDKVC